jgi:RecA-family ATPase
VSHPPGYDKWPRDQQDAWYAQAEAKAAHDEPKRGNGADDAPPDQGAPPIDDPDPEPPPPRIICPVIFKGRTLPPKRWIVPQWIPYDVVTGLYGDGGVGKTLAAQQLQTGTALGSSWLGLPVEEIASLGVYCEDGENDLWRRQRDIDVAYAVKDDDSLALAHWMPRLGEDNILMTFARSGVGQLTTFHRHVVEAALDLKARLVIIDTAADTFGGNENDRGQVRQFVQRALGQIALRIDGAVVCCAHPSRAGLSSGEGDSGSTGWSNAFRSRAYINRPKGENGEPVDNDARIITRKKANFASVGDTIKLHWKNGVIVPDALAAPSYFRRPADDVFLALLDEHCDANRQPLSENSHSGNYAPKVFAALSVNERDGYGQGDFRQAMERLFRSRKIKAVTYGRRGDERRKIERCNSEE